jgi:hypothetical protein
LIVATAPVGDAAAEASSLPLSFDLYPGDGMGLDITWDDCRRLHFMVRSSGLAAATPHTVWRTLADEAVSGGAQAAAAAGMLLTKAAFDGAVRRLIPGGELPKPSRLLLSTLLTAVYTVYDRGSSTVGTSTGGGVDAQELAAGMGMLCAGSKSAKLAFAWDLFDADGDGSLSRRELWRFLRGLLTMLFALSERAAAQPAAVLHDRIDDVAVEATQLVFSRASAATGGGATSKRVSFAQFGEVYNSGT